MIPIFSGKKTGDFFDFNDLDSVVNYLASFKENETLSVTIEKEKKPHSDPQRRYYYGVIVKLIADFTGHDKNEIDSILKWEFLIRTDDRGIRYVPSKNDLTTVETEEFFEKCRNWALIALDLIIPLPNEVKIEGE